MLIAVAGYQKSGWLQSLPNSYRLIISHFPLFLKDVKSQPDPESIAMRPYAIYAPFPSLSTVLMLALSISG